MHSHRTLSKGQQKAIGIAALVIAILLMGQVCWRIGVPMLRFASEPEHFRRWVQANGFTGQLAYIGMVILQVVIAIIPGEPLEIAGGYAFGALEGTLLCLIAATLGSLLVFALVRRYGMRLAEIFFPQSKLRSLRFLQSSPRRDFLFLLIFTIPGTPKDLLCYFAGLTDLKLGTWLLICSLGRLPSIVTSTVGGDALGSQSYLFAAITFAVTLAISSTGMLAYNHIRRRSSNADMKDAPKPPHA